MNIPICKHYGETVHPSRKRINIESQMGKIHRYNGGSKNNYHKVLMGESQYLATINKCTSVNRGSSNLQSPIRLPIADFQKFVTFVNASYPALIHDVNTCFVPGTKRGDYALYQLPTALDTNRKLALIFDNSTYTQMGISKRSYDKIKGQVDSIREMYTKMDKQAEHAKPIGPPPSWMEVVFPFIIMTLGLIYFSITANDITRLRKLSESKWRADRMRANLAIRRELPEELRRYTSEVADAIAYDPGQLEGLNGEEVRDHVIRLAQSVERYGPLVNGRDIVRRSPAKPRERETDRTRMDIDQRRRRWIRRRRRRMRRMP